MKKITTLAQLKALVAPGESETLELKKTTGETHAGFQDFASLLNHKGGYLVFGVDPNGTILGQQIVDKTRRDVADEVVKIEPTVVPEQTEVSVRSNLSCIVVHAEPDPGAVPYTHDGRGFERVGSTTRRMKQPRYEQLLKRRQNAISTWETEPAAGVRPADLSAARVRFVAKEGKVPQAGRAAIRALLNSLGVIRADKQVVRAGVVAFGQSLMPHYPQCRVRLARFAGTKSGGSFVDPPREVEGNIFDLLEAAETFIKKHVPTPTSLPHQGMQRVARELVPHDALREVLVNAFAHRDYGQVGASVGVAIFDDRVEIENPGEFPASIDPDHFMRLHPSLPRNPVIASILHRAHFMEKWGTGGQRIQQACKNAGTKLPRIVVGSGVVRVSFRAKLPQTARLGPIPQGTLQVTPQVVAVLRAALIPKSRAELQAAAGLKNRAHFIASYLSPMTASGWLEPLEPARSTRQRYRITARGRRHLPQGR